MKIYKNTELSNSDYHAEKNHVSSTWIKKALKEPHNAYKHLVLKEPKEAERSDAMDIGSYLHSLVLEPDKTNDEFLVYSGATSKSKGFTDFQAQNTNKQVVSKNSYNEAMALYRTYGADSVMIDGKSAPISSLFSNGEKELSIFAEDTLGIKTKVRFDYVDDKVIRDIKTTALSVENVDEARAVIWKSQYHVSAYFYIMHLAKHLGVSSSEIRFQWVFASKKTKRWTVVEMGEEMRSEAKDKVLDAIKIIKKMYKKDKSFLIPKVMVV